MQCPNCHAENKPDAAFCTKCGSKLHSAQLEPSKNRAIWNRLSPTVLLIIIAVGAVIYLIGQDGAESAAHQIWSATFNGNAELKTHYSLIKSLYDIAKGIGMLISLSAGGCLLSRVFSDIAK